MVNPLTRGFMVGGAVKQSNTDRQLRMNEKTTQKNIEQIDIGNFGERRKMTISQLSELKDTITGMEARGASPEKIAELKKTATAIAEQSMGSLAQQAQVLGLDPQLEVLNPIQTALQTQSTGQRNAGEVLDTASALEQGGVPKAQAQAAAGIPQPAREKKLKVIELMDNLDAALASGDNDRAKLIQSAIDKEVADSDSKGLLTLAQQGKVQLELAKQTSAAVNYAENVAQLVSLLDEGGLGAASLAGDTARITEGAASNAVGVARNFGVDTSKFTSGKGADERVAIADKILSKNAALNARQKSIITELAYAAAAIDGQTGRAVSDKDFENYLSQLGASAGNPGGFKKVLTDTVGRMQRKVKSNFEAKNKLLDKPQEIPDVMAIFESAIPKKGEGEELDVVLPNEVKNVFDSMEEAEASSANIPDGTIVTIGGKKYEWRK